MVMENIHSEMYSTLIDTIMKVSSKKDELFDEMYASAYFIEKVAWQQLWMNTDTTYTEKLAALTCVEWIFSCGSFASFNLIQEKNLMPGLCMASGRILTDKRLHTQFACHLYSQVYFVFSYVINVKYNLFF